MCRSLIAGIRDVNMLERRAFARVRGLVAFELVLKRIGVGEYREHRYPHAPAVRFPSAFENRVSDALRREKPTHRTVGVGGKHFSARHTTQKTMASTDR